MDGGTLVGTGGGETLPGADTPYGTAQWSPENTAGNQHRTARGRPLSAP
jgi:hypothetical protein